MDNPESQFWLPAGVTLKKLTNHVDSRGSLVEIFRDEWRCGVEPVQWNFVTSGARVLRGVHLHLIHADYLVVAQGRMDLGLVDCRNRSATKSSAIIVRMEPTTAIVIPPGVAHGFYFPEPSIHIYSVDHTWNIEDELGCHWNDPDLQLNWSFTDPILSPRDASLPSFADLVKAIPAEL